MPKVARTYRLAPRRYRSPFSPRYLRDAPQGDKFAHLSFHLESGDYFGTLATVLGLIESALAAPSLEALARDRCAKALQAARAELVYLQETHVIERRKS